MSQVKRNGVLGRPAWNYLRKGEEVGGANQQDVLEMIESVRNAIEQLGKSQMLQCDVALAIKGMAREMQGLRRDLKRKRG